jgi:hypothetical protein
MELSYYSWVSSVVGLLPPAVKRLLRLRYALLCKSSSFQNATCVQELRDLFVAESSPEEAPEEEKYDDRGNSRDRTVLL